MTARVQQDIDNGVSIGVSGTPAAFLLSNSGEIRVIAGAQPLTALTKLVFGV